jgi:hypothetical protein
VNETTTAAADADKRDLIVEFDRVGRNHHVPALVMPWSDDAEILAAQIWKHIKGLLVSREVLVDVELADASLPGGEIGRGWISAGVHSAGTFILRVNKHEAA